MKSRNKGIDDENLLMLVTFVEENIFLIMALILLTRKMWIERDWMWMMWI